MVEVLQFPKRAIGALIGVLLLATHKSAFAADLRAAGDMNGDSTVNVLAMYDILNVKLRPAFGTGQGVLYQLHAAIGWLGSGATESTNYRFSIEF